MKVVVSNHDLLDVEELSHMMTFNAAHADVLTLPIIETHGVQHWCLRIAAS
jgi:hypothetical protein